MEITLPITWSTPAKGAGRRPSDDVENSIAVVAVEVRNRAPAGRQPKAEDVADRLRHLLKYAPAGVPQEFVVRADPEPPYFKVTTRRAVA